MRPTACPRRARNAKLQRQIQPEEQIVNAVDGDVRELPVMTQSEMAPVTDSVPRDMRMDRRMAFGICVQREQEVQVLYPRGESGKDNKRCELAINFRFI